MELLSIAAILLGFLALLARAGVWIGVALMATGWAGCSSPRRHSCGSVLATTVVGQKRVVVARGPFHSSLDGRDSPSARAYRRKCFADCALAELAAGPLMHVNVLACGVFGSVSGSSAAT